MKKERLFASQGGPIILAQVNLTVFYENIVSMIVVLILICQSNFLSYFFSKIYIFFIIIG